ncbi:S8 family peptidase [Myxococcota bacterium]|nr:S8 family peptidase [Myxococcota bacterium]
MRHTPIALAAPLALFAITTTPPARAADPRNFAPREILVDLADDTTDADEADLERAIGGIDLHLNSPQATEERFFVAEVSPFVIDRVLATLRQDPRVEHAEPNFIYGIPEPEGFDAVEPRSADAAPTDDEGKGPNDPLWERQWSFRMIDAPAAWRYANGKGVVVAVIDTGVAYEEHKKFKRVEDLAGVEFVKPYDFVADTEHANDDHGHGTHVAGTIAQATNNGLGVAGIAHGAKIMPLKVLNKAGMGTAADIADAIRYAADEGAHVINMSLGGGGRSQVMESAVAYARNKGVVVVCAAGNGSQGKVEFPAAYPGAFAVSSVGPDKKLAFYSSWGKELAISAPGGDKQKGGDAGAILQNTITPDKVGVTNQYLAFQGTSMATPHVAAVAALVISAGVTDPARVEEILKATATKAPEQTADWDARYGAGILDAGRAVSKAHDAKTGLPYFLAGLGTLAAFALRLGRRAGALRFGVAGVVVSILASSGLWFLEHLGLGGLPGVSVLSSAMPTWDFAIVGASLGASAVWVSAVPVFALAVLLLGVKGARGILAALALGWAAHLAVAAVLMPSDVLLVPGVASVFDRAWLVINAGALVLLAGIIARVHARRA